MYIIINQLYYLSCKYHQQNNYDTLVPTIDI